MKKMIMAMLAFALAGSAFADTKTEGSTLYGSNSYIPKSDGSKLGNPFSNITLGNYYYLSSSYITDNIFELDVSAFDFESIDSVKIKAAGGFNTAYGALPLDETIGAIKISFYEGGTGDAETDWDAGSVTLVKEISGLSTKELKNGITINDLGFGNDDFVTFVISIDPSLIPQMTNSGEGIGIEATGSMFQLTFTGTTAAVPEPSTYAAIFGALALGFAIYRRRK